MTGLLILGGFVLLVALGVPIAVALAAPAILYVLLEGLPLSLVAHHAVYSVNKFTLLAIPLFILAGNLMNNSGITSRIFGFAYVLVGRWRGGYAQMNVVNSLIFSGMSGAALADVGGMGSMEIKAMTEAGYKKSFAAGLTLASATVGPIFPPSIPLIVFAATAEVSAVQLLLAGIGPALITTVAMMALTAYLAVRYRLPKQEERLSFQEITSRFWQAVPALLTPVILVGGMLGGIFTATEAAAVTVLWVLFINVFVYRDFRWRDLWEATKETARVTSVILFLVVGASVFGRVLALEQVPQQSAQFLLSLSENPFVLLLLVNLLLLVVGMFVDMIGALLLLVPLIVPTLVLVGVDPVHLGLVVVFNLMIGAMTPPVGVTLFLVSDIAKVSIENVLREVWPYMVLLLGVLLVLTYVPAISLWVPSLLR